MHRKIVLLVAVGVSGCLTAKPVAPAPPPPAAPAWEVPEGWKQETIPFPLDFAPELRHRGVEVLRFAPGFFDPTKQGYWSYAWAWWLEDAEVPGRAQLERELVEYFRGLSKAVSEEKHRDFDPSRFSAHLQDAPAPRPGWAAYWGDVESMDAFTTGAPLYLRVSVWTSACAKAGRRVVLVAASARPPADNHSTWVQLGALLDHFPCE